MDYVLDGSGLPCMRRRTFVETDASSTIGRGARASARDRRAELSSGGIGARAGNPTSPAVHGPLAWAVVPPAAAAFLRRIACSCEVDARGADKHARL